MLRKLLYKCWEKLSLDEPSSSASSEILVVAVLVFLSFFAYTFFYRQLDFLSEPGVANEILDVTALFHTWGIYELLSWLDWGIDLKSFAMTYRVTKAVRRFPWHGWNSVILSDILNIIWLISPNQCLIYWIFILYFCLFLPSFEVQRWTFQERGQKISKMSFYWWIPSTFRLFQGSELKQFELEIKEIKRTTRWFLNKKRMNRIACFAVWGGDFCEILIRGL